MQTGRNRDLKGLLIYPPNQLMQVETPRPDGSLSLLYLASSLKREGIEAEVLDTSVGHAGQSLEETFYRTVMQGNGLIRIGMGFDQIAEYVTHGRYDFAAISSNFTPQTNMAFLTAKSIRESNPTIPIFAGGVNARALRERFLMTGYFNAVCTTEGEVVFPRMVRAYFNNEGIGSVPGISYLRDGTLIDNPPTPECFPDLDSLPSPDWKQLPFQKYESIDSPHGVMANEARRGRRYAPIITGRGCDFHCLYCHISTEKDSSAVTGKIGRLRQHSIGRVLSEVDQLKDLGVQRLFFEDDSLLANKSRAKELFKGVKDRNLNVANVNGVNLMHLYNYQGTAGRVPWTVDEEFLDVLKNAGFDQLVFPVESGSKRIIQKYATNKVQFERMDLELLMRKLTQKGILSPVNMMIGFPDETESEMREGIDLARRLRDAGAPYVTFFIPIPFPGSKLYEIAVTHGYLNGDFDPDLFNWKRVLMKNTTVPHERIEEIRDLANAEINSEEHLRKRLLQSIGHRWKSS